MNIEINDLENQKIGSASNNFQDISDSQAARILGGNDGFTTSFERISSSSKVTSVATISFNGDDKTSSRFIDKDISPSSSGIAFGRGSATINDLTLLD